jgi:hypothetical protein
MHKEALKIDIVKKLENLNLKQLKQVDQFISLITNQNDNDSDFMKNANAVIASNIGQLKRLKD